MAEQLKSEGMMNDIKVEHRYNTRTLHYKSLVLDLEANQVFRGYKKIDLTPAEFNLLALFMCYPEKILTEEIITKKTRGYFIYDNSLIDVHIGTLRKKLGEPSLIQTVQSRGYVLS